MEKELLERRMTCLKEGFEDFKKKIRNYKYVSLFGVGRVAEHWGYEFVKEWGKDNIICFSDNNSDMWGKTIIEDLKCVSPMELRKYGNDIICVILVQESAQKEIAIQLKEQGTKTIGIRSDWLYIDSLIEKYLNIKLPAIWEGSCRMGNYVKDIDVKERVAVYTCIVNGYDDLLQPLVNDPRCDYFCLSLEKPNDLGIYQWINIEDMIPEYLENDFVRINRYCKLHPNLFFPQYKYSVYVDGRVLIHKELSKLVSKIGRIGIALYGIESVMDTYEHASSIYFSRFKGERREIIRAQMQKYVEEGFPRYFGFSENSVMVREHHNNKCIQIMNTWWNEIRDYSRRDQLSFFYSIWKNGFTSQDIGYIDATFRNGPEFSMGQHLMDINIKKFNRC